MKNGTIYILPSILTRYLISCSIFVCYVVRQLTGTQMSRSGLSGPGSSVTVGMAFGVPPILKFGSPQLQERFIPDLLRGKKRACIAITEPDAGSDVANIQTSAIKSKDGKHYIINGTKKWYNIPRKIL